MKHLIRISLCLFLGVVTTVGVAWGLALSHSTSIPLQARIGVLRPLDEPVWIGDHVRDFGTDYIEFSATSVGFGDEKPGDAARYLPRWSSGGTPPTLADVSNGVLVAEIAGGWPMRSNFCTVRIEGVTGVVSLAGGLAWQSSPADRPLPLRPIFPGFIINTLFYAAIWFGVFFGVGALRRFVRRKRGRCVKCSYDLRGAPGDDKGCPECGWNRTDQPPRRRDAEGANADS